MKKVAIIGAGFGGIAVARSLSKCKELQVDIIDRRNYHLFQPLLYQVAMAGLNPSDIAVPIRKLFSKKSNISVILAEVEDIDEENIKVLFDGQWRPYDYIVIACGAKHFYFGNDHWEPLAPGLKNIEQATEIRRRVLTAFEMAEKIEDQEKQKPYLTFTVVGGGPTGVELAGGIAEMAKQTLVKDYKAANLNQTQVVLVEAGPRVLSAFPKNLSARAKKDLTKMGVKVLTNTRASELSHDGLQLNDNWMACKTIIWAAGVKPSSLVHKINSEKDSQDRLVINNDLSLPNHPNIFAIGDLASLKDSNGDPLPGIAPVAIQQGQFLGQQIKNDLRNITRKEFKYWDKGIMATIGRSKAVVSSGKMQLTGFPAWMAWVLIHIVYLMQFKNRFFVFLQWIWAYFSFGQGARLIIHKTWRFYSGKKISYDE